MGETPASIAEAPVSVVIPTYRDGDALRRALSSIESQTLRPSQIVVVDDASSDGNAERVCGTSQLEGIQLIALDTNVGPGGARNAGIAASRERFVAFLDADDEGHPEKLERQMTVMLGAGPPSFSCHPKEFGGAPWTKLVAPPKASPIRRLPLLFLNFTPISTVVIRKDAIKYPFPHSYAGEDYVFVAANVLSGIPAVLLNQALARAHKPAFGEGGLSGRLHAMQLGEMRARFFLVKEGLISRGECAVLLIWGGLKYIRRLAIVFLRRAAALFGLSAAKW